MFYTVCLLLARPALFHHLTTGAQALYYDNQ
nr:MAG TPA: hypothetical protein [Bacteriophage sp.]